MSAESSVHVQLKPEAMMQIGNFTVTNTMFATVFVSLLLIVLALIIRSRLSMAPGRAQMALEFVFNEFYGRLENNVGTRFAQRLAPLLLSLFFFLIFANSFGWIPLLGSFTTEGGNLFRTPTSDYSLTVALAIMVVILSQLLAFFAGPLQHIGNYVKVKPFWEIMTGKRPVKELLNAFIEFFLGILDVVGELVKVISLGSRLFGNIIAGEIVVLVISSMFFFTSYLFPLPFIVLSTVGGLIQAFVFTLLATVFFSNVIGAALPPQALQVEEK